LKKTIQKECFLVTLCPDENEALRRFEMIPFEFVIISLDMDSKKSEQIIEGIKKKDTCSKVIAIGSSSIFDGVQWFIINILLSLSPSPHLTKI